MPAFEPTVGFDASVGELLFLAKSRLFDGPDFCPVSN